MKQENNSLFQGQSENNNLPKLEQVLSNHTLHTNIDNSTVLISEHTLKEHLRLYNKSKTSRLRWSIPASIFISLLGTFLATDFVDTTYFKKDFLEAIFSLMIFGSLGWLIWELVNINKYRQYSSIEKLMDKIKNKPPV